MEETETSHDEESGSESTDSRDDDAEARFSSHFKYSCSFSGCGLHFKRKNQLDSHEFTHTRTKKFKCPEENCDKAYVNNTNLQRHLRASHTPSDGIICCPIDSCGLLCDSEERLKEHKRRIHSGKPFEFECEICTTKFRRKTQLRQHMFEHTGNYRYRCSTCDKGFLQLGHLERHENVHKVRNCDLCDETFKTWSALVSHKRKDHTSDAFKCNVCDKIFHSKRNLKQHSKIHTNAENREVYACPFESCTKVFAHRNNVLTHYKSKHENRKFVCDVEGCGRELASKQKLKQHIASIHNDGDDETKPEAKNVTKSRAVRKDKGNPKISTASKLFNIILPPDMERAIMNGAGKSIEFSYRRLDDEENSAITTKQTETNFPEGIVQC